MSSFDQNKSNLFSKGNCKISSKCFFSQAPVELCVRAIVEEFDFSVLSDENVVAYCVVGDGLDDVLVAVDCFVVAVVFDDDVDGT